MKYSFVLPVYNEADNIEAVYNELREVAKTLDGTFEIIFVNDGSHDETQNILEKLDCIVVELTRNFGQTAALDAGIKTAKGEYIITLDGDGQNDPHSVPKLIEHLHETKADVVCGWRKNRQDSFLKKQASIVARALRSLIIHDQIHDSGCTLRVYKRSCLEGFTIRGEMHRFIPVLLQWEGYKVTELPVQHRERMSGKSKYSMNRTIHGLLDLLSLWFFHKYQSRPLHFLGSIGIVSGTLGSTILIVMAILRIFWKFPLSEKIWPLMGVFLVLFGFQLFVSGLIMDLILSFNTRDMYVIRKIHHKND